MIQNHNFTPVHINIYTGSQSNSRNNPSPGFLNSHPSNWVFKCLAYLYFQLKIWPAFKINHQLSKGSERMGLISASLKKTTQPDHNSFLIIEREGEGETQGRAAVWVQRQSTGRISCFKEISLCSIKTFNWLGEAYPHYGE